jgi:hypothetical protein
MATYTRVADHDTFITDDLPAANWNGFGLRSGVAIGAKVRRLLLHFDLADFPDYLSIDDANISIAIHLDGVLDVAATLYRITQPAWVEGAATWNRYNALTNWSTPGGDYDAATPPPVQFFQPRNPGQLIITGLRAFVVDALEQRSAQLHVLARQNNEAAVFGEYTYRDGEYHAGLGQALPLLTVQYTRPSETRVVDDPRSTIGASKPARSAGASRAAAPSRPSRPHRT